MAQNYYSGTIWEKQVAYCRAKRVDKFVFVAGTTSVDENGNIVGLGNLYEQTIFIFAKIRKALQYLGADMKDVVRTRTFVVNIKEFEQFAKAHKEIFEGIDPVASCIEVSGFVNKELLVEIEIDAIIQ